MTIQSDRGDMQPHDFADLFPLMSDPDLNGLVESIRSNGLREAIVTHEGKILDGRNRYAACAKAGVVPEIVEYEGDNPLGYVIDKNLHRRHLSESQRAMVASKMISAKVGRPAKNSANLRNKDAAELAHVSTRLVESASAVYAQGTPELIMTVEQGEIAVSLAAKIAKEMPDAQREILAADDPKTQIKRRNRIERLQAVEGTAAAMPDREYAVIYADPPWSWDTYSEAGKDRTPENHYPLMDADAITSLDVPAADTAVLFLWTTVPHLETALGVIKSWGFAYKSNIVWRKDRIGTGYWSRNRHEHLLIATRGDIPAPIMGDQCESVIDAKVGKHSAKPEDFRDVIDNYYPGVTKLELFSRGAAAEGWDTWGNEAVGASAGVGTSVNASGIDADTDALDDEDTNKPELAPVGSPTRNPQIEPAEAGPESESLDPSTSTDCSDASPVETLEKPVPGNDETRETKDDGDGDDNGADDFPDIPPKLDRRPKPEGT
jgi:N6-adenosine-specific RNA methylase IME4